ncbi:MAG: PQQ-dependent sugar dehydrogenase, partial [Haliea sp.]|nr:PQQ-dependent sugar dehydrogenase [Haliea sp.]
MSILSVASRLLIIVSLWLSLPATAADYRLETLAEGLHHPWSVAQLPDGSFLVTERRGSLLHLSADGTQRTTIAGVPSTFVAGQGGFFDILLHPEFAANGLVYLSYARGDAAANGTAIRRARLADNALLDGEDILWV